MIQLRKVAKAPFVPFGMGAGVGADMMDAAAPGVAMVGDALTDSVAPVLGEMGAAAGTAASDAVASALSAIPGVGPALGGATGTAGTLASQIAPRLAAAGAQIAQQAPKLAGRALYGATSAGLRGLEGMTGASPFGPAQQRALGMRAMQSSGLPSKPGWEPPTMASPAGPEASAARSAFQGMLPAQGMNTPSTASQPQPGPPQAAGGEGPVQNPMDVWNNALERAKGNWQQAGAMGSRGNPSPSGQSPLSRRRGRMAY